MSIYTEFFSFNAQPFSITPDPRFLYSSTLHQEGLAHLTYGIQGNGGFVALTGEVGTGKTMLCHCLLQHLPENVDIALILNPRLDAMELLASICDELGIYYAPNELTLKHLNDALNKYLLIAHSRGRHTVLMIDEAQNLSLEVLEQIRLLTNLETATEKLLQIILVGQPELQELLERSDLRQLNQRITARFHLQALDAEDTRKYIRHRLVGCNGQPDIFTPEAIKRIFKYSAGVPRVINILCDRCLLGAYTLDKQQIDATIVKQAARELQISSSTFPAKNWGWPVLWLFLACIIVLVSNSGVRQAFSTLSFIPRWLSGAEANIAPASFSSTPLRERLSVPSSQWGMNGYFSTGYGKAKPTGDSAQQSLPAEQAPAPVADAPENQPNVVQDNTKQQGNVLLDAPLNDNKIASNIISFSQLIEHKSLTLTAALKHGTRALNKNLPDSALVNCEGVERFGIHCLKDRSSWNKVFSYQRPVILEFDITPKRKIYVLLKLSKDGKVVLHADAKLVLDLGDLLSAWNGNYIILWESPFSGSKEIAPGENSQAVSWLRALIAMPASDGENRYFDDALRDRVMAFQAQHNLLADGVAGGRTLILLQNKKQTAVATSAPPPDK